MYNFFLKRLFDVFLCVFAVVVLSPVFLFAAVGIKLSSKGPVLYSSERAGIYKKSFKFYKFRSMHQTNNDKGLFIADKDRLFPFGKIMRRTKIDELPQLINVIKGDMSIVGPRPMPMSSVDTTYYGKYAEVLSVRPGLTSPASLFDYTVGDTYTNNDDYIKYVLPVKLEMELFYVKNSKFSYDASIVGRTVSIIIMTILGKKRFKQQPEYNLIMNGSTNEKVGAWHE